MPNSTPPPPIRPWIVICADGSQARLGSSSKDQATSTATELFPGWLRLEPEGEW